VHILETVTPACFEIKRGWAFAMAKISFFGEKQQKSEKNCKSLQYINGPYISGIVSNH